MLLHWPCDLIEAGTLGAVWRELERLRDEGRCRSLGVSNFNIEALRMLLPLCRSARPTVNQVERHPLLPQWDLMEFCAHCGIVMQAHTPLGGVLGKSKLINHPTIIKVAKEAGLSAAQVLIQWNIRHNVAVAVKCTSETHASEVVAVLDKNNNMLAPSHMEALDTVSENSVAPKRFVAPPFMYKKNALYSWGDAPPKQE